MVIAMRRKAAEKLEQASKLPDLVDRIFELLAEEVPELGADVLAEAKLGVRAEFGSSLGYIRSGHEARRQELARMILALFNGRNASEVARELDISRATVYRFLKQPGVSDKLSHVPKRLETEGTLASAQPTAPQASKAAETD